MYIKNELIEHDISKKYHLSATVKTLIHSCRLSISCYWLTHSKDEVLSVSVSVRGTIPGDTKKQKRKRHPSYLHISMMSN